MRIIYLYIHIDPYYTLGMEVTLKNWQPWNILQRIKHTQTQTDTRRQTHTDRHKGRHTDTDTQADRQTDTQARTHAHPPTHIHTHYTDTFGMELKFYSLKIFHGYPNLFDIYIYIYKCQKKDMIWLYYTSNQGSCFHTSNNATLFHRWMTIV